MLEGPPPKSAIKDGRTGVEGMTVTVEGKQD